MTNSSDKMRKALVQTKVTGKWATVAVYVVPPGQTLALDIAYLTGTNDSRIKWERRRRGDA